jgi:hypothetical protein
LQLYMVRRARRRLFGIAFARVRLLLSPYVTFTAARMASGRKRRGGPLHLFHTALRG